MLTKGICHCSGRTFPIKLLDVEGIEQAVVLCYSPGGGLAQAFAQSHSERVEHLVLSHCASLSAETAERVGRMVNVINLLPLLLIRALFKARSQSYPAAQTHVFEQGGHHTVLLSPELYAATVTTFLEGLA